MTLPSTAPACRRWLLRHMSEKGRIVYSEKPSLVEKRHQVQIFNVGASDGQPGYIETYGKSAHVAYRRAMEAMNARQEAA